MTPEVSIIVPCFNVEKFIERCVRSLVQQSFQNIEVILVNDGSTDSTQSILRKMARQDSRLRVIDQVNSGLSGARNSGLEVFRGKFVAFVDADDHVSSDFIESMLENAKKNEDHVICCRVVEEDFVSGNLLEFIPRDEPRVYDIRRAYLDLARSEGRVRFEVWNKLFPRATVESLRFKIGQTYEDVYFLRRVLERSRGVIINTKARYFYLTNRPGSTNSSFPNGRLAILYELDDYIEMFKARSDNDLADRFQILQFLTRISLLVDAYRLGAPSGIKSEILNGSHFTARLSKNPFLSTRRLIFYFLFGHFYARNYHRLGFLERLKRHLK